VVPPPYPCPTSYQGKRMRRYPWSTSMVTALCISPRTRFDNSSTSQSIGRMQSRGSPQGSKATRRTTLPSLTGFPQRRNPMCSTNDTSKKTRSVTRCLTRFSHHVKPNKSRRSNEKRDESVCEANEVPSLQTTKP